MHKDMVYDVYDVCIYAHTLTPSLISRYVTKWDAKLVEKKSVIGDLLFSLEVSKKEPDHLTTKY